MSSVLPSCVFFGPRFPRFVWFLSTLADENPRCTRYPSYSTCILWPSVRFALFDSVCYSLVMRTRGVCSNQTALFHNYPLRSQCVILWFSACARIPSIIMHNQLSFTPHSFIVVSKKLSSSVQILSRMFTEPSRSTSFVN